MVCSIVYVNVTLMTLMYIEVVHTIGALWIIWVSFIILFWLMSRQSPCGDSGITITVSLINHSSNTSASHCELLIEILPLELLWSDWTKGSGGNKKLLSHRIPTIGIVQKLLSTTNTTINKHHHHGGAVRSSYGMGLMDPPIPMQVTSSEGVGQGCLGWV